MTQEIAPFRSVLYVPGSNERALEKIASLPVDAVILDLEDAVLPDRKDAARASAAKAIAAAKFGYRYVAVRINALSSAWGAEDLSAAIDAGPDAIVIPKTETPRCLWEVDSRMPRGMGLWAMMETPLGILNAQSIATATPRLQALVMGTNDLLSDLHGHATADRIAVRPAMSQCLLAARSQGLICLDGVYNAIADDDGLRAECLQGRAMGFDGKTLIHPGQIETANQVFAPDDADIAAAHGLIAAYDAAAEEGQGVAVYDGRIVENLHVKTARRTLALSKAIQTRAEEA